MHRSISNLNLIKEELKSKINNFHNVKIIAVSKTFPIETIKPLIECGHLEYGENKVQEAITKWTDIKLSNPNIKLHLIGKLQTNKVRDCLKYFDFIHSVDSKKLAKKICDEQIKINKTIKIFIQVNIGGEEQKSGINKNNLEELIVFCKKLKLNLIGLMCIPPINGDTNKYFSEMSFLKTKYNLDDLSMGMSSDYLKAVENSSTYLRIGSSIFGNRA